MWHAAQAQAQAQVRVLLHVAGKCMARGSDSGSGVGARVAASDSQVHSTWFRLNVSLVRCVGGGRRGRGVTREKAFVGWLCWWWPQGQGNNTSERFCLVGCVGGGHRGQGSNTSETFVWLVVLVVAAGAGNQHE